jgi:N-acetylmuramoyl-L-alanine amidase
MVRPTGDLYIGGEKFHIDAPVVNWHDNGWDATSLYCIPTPQEPAPGCPPGADGQFPHGPPVVQYTRRYSTRPNLPASKLSYNAVRAMVKQFVVHHDGCLNAEMCFNVLQNERGLSVHFLLDNDGTIYQTIDLGLMAYHAAEWNLWSIGVELCNRGDAIKEPDYYRRHGDPNRGTALCKINNNTIKSFVYTDAQMKAFIQLCRALTKLLPNLPADYPQSTPGEQMWNTLPNALAERERYAGYIGHYHLTQQKWDPGPFDFKDFCSKLRGALCFPMFPRMEPAKPEDTKPIVPDDGGDLKQAANDLYKLNEERADGGFFPVAPWGESRLWHGGIHVIGKLDGGVFAPYPGRLVAARMGQDSSIGSFNFVLLRHELSLGKAKIRLYSLYMHLADERKRTQPVEWMTKDGWKANGKPGVVALLDEPIEAGALIGHVGKVGPDELSRPQVHIEFFSDRMIEGFDEQWTLIDGSAGGRFCDAPEIVNLIDQNKDKILSRKEVNEFFANGQSNDLRHMVTLHVSEWIAEPNWADALRAPKDFQNRKPAEIEAMVNEQITPGLWWTDAVATHCKLPKDGVVYHYHPIAFISWFKNQLIEAAIAASRTRETLTDKDARKVPPTVTDDREGGQMKSTADIAEDPCNNLTLEQMVQGFDAPECTAK